jgi:endoglycosylceramidase
MCPTAPLQDLSALPIGVGDRRVTTEPMRRWTSLVLIGAAASACAPDVVSPVAVGPQAPFSVAEGRIVDATGATVLLRGVNLSQTAKSAPFRPVEVEDEAGRAVLRAHGPLALRYLTSWAAIEPEDGTFDEAYLEALATRLASPSSAFGRLR